MKRYLDQIGQIILMSFLVFITFTVAAPKEALADIGGLTKCSDSAAFLKRLNTSVTKLEARIGKYEKESLPALALQQIN